MPETGDVAGFADALHEDGRFTGRLVTIEALPGGETEVAVIRVTGVTFHGKALILLGGDGAGRATGAVRHVEIRFGLHGFASLGELSGAARAWGKFAFRDAETREVLMILCDAHSRFPGVTVNPSFDDGVFGGPPCLLHADAATLRAVAAVAATRRATVAAVLNDQGTIVGVGNTIKSEALHALAVDPRAAARDVGSETLVRLYAEAAALATRIRVRMRDRVRTNSLAASDPSIWHAHTGCPDLLCVYMRRATPDGARVHEVTISGRSTFTTFPRE